MELGAVKEGVAAVRLSRYRANGNIECVRGFPDLRWTFIGDAKSPSMYVLVAKEIVTPGLSILKDGLGERFSGKDGDWRSLRRYYYLRNAILLRAYP